MHAYVCALVCAYVVYTYVVYNCVYLRVAVCSGVNMAGRRLRREKGGARGVASGGPAGVWGAACPNGLGSEGEGKGKSRGSTLIKKEEAEEKREREEGKKRERIIGVDAKGEVKGKGGREEEINRNVS